MLPEALEVLGQVSHPRREDHEAAPFLRLHNGQKLLFKSVHGFVQFFEQLTKEEVFLHEAFIEGACQLSLGKK